MSLLLLSLLILRDFWLIFSVTFASSVCFLSAAFWGDIALDEDDLRMFRRRAVGSNRTDSGRINLPTWGQQVQTRRSEPIVSCVSLCSSWRQTEPPSPEEGGHLQTRAGVAWRHHPVRHQREFQWWVVMGNLIPCGAPPRTLKVSYTPIPSRQPESHFPSGDASLGETHLRDVYGEDGWGELHRVHLQTLRVSSVPTTRWFKWFSWLVFAVHCGWIANISNLNCHKFTVSALASVGGLSLLPNGSTGIEDIWLARFKCNKQKVHPINFQVF